MQLRGKTTGQGGVEIGDGTLTPSHLGLLCKNSTQGLGNVGDKGKIWLPRLLWFPRSIVWLGELHGQQDGQSLRGLHGA